MDSAHLTGRAGVGRAGEGHGERSSDPGSLPYPRSVAGSLPQDHPRLPLPIRTKWKMRGGTGVFYRGKGI